jgi:hypothetical protein
VAGDGGIYSKQCNYRLCEFFALKSPYFNSRIIPINLTKGKQMTEKRLTLNSEKRKAIADVFQDHFELNSPKYELHKKSIADYNEARTKMKVLADTVVRHHQPQEDVDTIRSMIKKYSSSGGQLYNDNCFYFTAPPRMETDSDGDKHERVDEEHVKFNLEESFARSYYRDEIKAKGLNPDFHVAINGNYDKRSPSYYTMESQVNKFTGHESSSNDNKTEMSYKDEWEKDFQLTTIGSSYCHSRMFAVDQETFETFKMYNSLREQVKLTHQQLFSHVNGKMEKLKLGLKSYRYFDQAKDLADKLGVALNEGILNESSSMALSVYSPTNLADLLTDKVEQTRDEKIAIARQIMQQATVN